MSIPDEVPLPFPSLPSVGTPTHRLQNRCPTLFPGRATLRPEQTCKPAPGQAQAGEEGEGKEGEGRGWEGGGGGGRALAEVTEGGALGTEGLRTHCF